MNINNRFNYLEAVYLKAKNTLFIPKTSSQLVNKINRIFWIGIGCWSTYNSIDAGLARFFALETLTHGAGPLGYIGITFNGADPNYGGGSTGSSVGGGKYSNILNSENFFHVFKDTAFSNSPCIKTSYPMPCNLLASQILPRYHAMLSGMATFGYSKAYGTENFLQGALGAVSGLLTPTLKFRFIPEEILHCTHNCRFENDPFYSNVAYRTSKPIPSNHIGILGSLSQGINAEMYHRMSAHPQKVMLGVTLLGIAALVAKTTYGYINSMPQVKLNKPPKHPVSSFMNCKKIFKSMTLRTCRATCTLTLVFLNTL